MYSLVLSLLLALSAEQPMAPMAAAPDTLSCRVTADAGAPRRCSVTIPSGRAIRACAAADAAAGRCDKKGNTQYVAWVMSHGGAKCEISRKRTDWTRRVTVKRSKKSAGPRAMCELRVVLR
ncbi:MAG: hypothetical protein ACT4PJ_10525 [Gemmatimonadaceae bacterium]